MKKAFSPPRLVAAAVILLFAAAACGGGVPEELEIQVKLEQGKLNPATIRVKQGDMVTLKIETEEPGQLHLHGYDIEKDIPAGEVVDLYFVAETAGRYMITVHAGDSAHGGIFQSEMLEPGDVFTYEAVDNLAGSIVAFHSHQRPAVAGSLTVLRDAPPAERVEIEITDTAATPAEIVVRPGTAITWTNNGLVAHTVVSGRHADAFVGLEGSDSPAGEEEPRAGYLEVLPR